MMDEPRRVDTLVHDETDPAFALDGEDKILSCNAAARELLSLKEVRGRRLVDVLELRDVFGNRMCPSHCGLREMARRGEAIGSFEVELASAASRPISMVVDVQAVASPGSPSPDLVLRLRKDRRRRGDTSAARPARPGNGRHVEGRTRNGLTQRQIEVLSLLAAGRTTREVASELSISVNTVRNHQQNILRRLDVHHLAMAVATAIRSGLI